MFNPGFIYLIGTGILYFVNDKLRYLLTIVFSLLGVVMIYNLPYGQETILPFLNFNLVILTVNNISKIIGITFAFFGLCSIIYSRQVANKKYYLLGNIYLGNSIAILFVGDFFSFYICWEMMTVSSYFLIFSNQQPVTKQTSYYYFVMQMVGAVSLLWGIILQYTATGSIALGAVEYGLPFFMVAIGIKLAFIGLHTWLPKNYANVPFYISVLLSAYTTKVGVYALYRLLGNINLGYAGIITAILGVLLALRQTKVRKLLSYHIISQIGYMITAIGVRSSLGIAGGITHLVNNVLYKGLLFMVIGTVIYRTDKEDLVDLGGLAKKLPVTTFYALVASLGIAGVPFFNGHISKLLIKKGVSDPILTWGLYLAGIGTSLSFLKIMYFGFFSNPKSEIKIKRKSDSSMLIGMGLITALIIIIGVKPDLLINILNSEIKPHYFSGYYIWLALQPTLLALIIFKLAHDIIEPYPHATINIDLYPLIGKGMDYLGQILSKIHNGHLNRYLLWLLTTLVILCMFFQFDY